MKNHVKKLVFDDLDFEPPKPGKSSVCSCSLSQSIGRGRMSREGAIDVRESRERRDKNFAEKTENAKMKILDQKQQFEFSISMSNAWGICIFLLRKNQFFGGGRGL